MAFIARLILTLVGIYLLILMFSSWIGVGFLALWVLAHIAYGKK